MWSELNNLANRWCLFRDRLQTKQNARSRCYDLRIGGNNMRTTFMANESNTEHKWYIVDAAGQTLGRLSSEVASIIRGKYKTTFTPHDDS